MNRRKREVFQVDAAQARFMTCGSPRFRAGALRERLGWRAVNIGVAPLIAAIPIAIVWWTRTWRAPATTPDG